MAENIQVTSTTEYLPVGKCEYCGKFLIVMTTASGSVLPVEVESRDIKIDKYEEFSSRKHKSHLLSCIPQREAWEKKKWKYIKQRNGMLKFFPKTDKELFK